MPSPGQPPSEATAANSKNGNPDQHGASAGAEVAAGSGTAAAETVPYSSGQITRSCAAVEITASSEVPPSSSVTPLGSRNDVPEPAEAHDHSLSQTLSSLHSSSEVVVPTVNASAAMDAQEPTDCLATGETAASAAEPPEETLAIIAKMVQFIQVSPVREPCNCCVIALCDYTVWHIPAVID